MYEDSLTFVNQRNESGILKTWKPALAKITLEPSLLSQEPIMGSCLSARRV